MKGLTRIDQQLDVVKLIRKSFIHDAIMKRLLNPERRGVAKSKGKFIIEPANL
jgi:hypothetical protein